MKKLIILVIVFILMIGTTTLSYATMNNEAVEVGFLQSVKKQGDYYDIAEINGRYFIMHDIEQIRPTITFVVPEEYDGETIQIEYQAEAYMQDGSLKLLDQNKLEKNAEAPKMKIECPMQLNDYGQAVNITLQFWLTFKTKDTIAEPYEFTVKLQPFVEPILKAELFYPETVVTDLQSYTVEGDITLTGGSLETINNVIVLESSRGEVVNVSSLAIGETISYQEPEDLTINSNTLLPIEQTYTIQVQYDNPMVKGGRTTVQLENTATTRFTKTQINEGLTLSLNPSIDAISETKEVDVVAEITNNTEEEMIGIQLFSELGLVTEYEGKIPAHTSIMLPFQLNFEPGILQDFYVLHSSAVTGEAYKGVAEIVIPVKSDEFAPEELKEKQEAEDADEEIETTKENQKLEINDVNKEEGELIADNSIVIEEIDSDDKDATEVKTEKNKTTNIFIKMMFIALAIVVLSILAIILTNRLIKRKH